MSFDNNDADEFVDLWKKKKKTQEESPPPVKSETAGRLGDTELKLLNLQNENIELKKKIQMNLQVVEQSEQAIRNSLQEKEKLRSAHQQEITSIKGELDIVTSEKIELNNKFQQIQGELSSKEREISEIKAKLKNLEKNASSPSASSPVSSDLIENLQSELSKKKAQIQAYEKNFQEYDDKIRNYEAQIEDLTKDNTELSDKLTEALNSSSSGTEGSSLISRPSSSAASSGAALNSLVQDLQSQINKYKNIIKVLREDNTRLEKTVSEGGADALSRDVKTLRKQNEELKKQLADLEKISKKDTKKVPETVISEKAPKKIEEKLEEKDRLLAQLQKSKPAPASTPSGLIEDLQVKLNKYKRIVKQLKEENAKLKSGSS